MADSFVKGNYNLSETDNSTLLLIPTNTSSTGKERPAVAEKGGG